MSQHANRRSADRARTSGAEQRDASDTASITPTRKRQRPPRPQLAFRVGVVGHRPNRLSPEKLPELYEVVAWVLAQTKSAVEECWDPQLYAEAMDRRVLLRAVSPLAEGSDRIFAAQALNLGYALCCVMPFAQAEFENDFDAKSVAEFHGLLTRARQDPDFTSYELDGTRVDPAAAYGVGGDVVVNQSDLLIVIWDGERLGKKGGTEETFAYARNCQVPCVWIDARNPSVWQVIDEGQPTQQPAGGGRAIPLPHEDPVEAIRAVVHRHLSIPRPADAVQTDASRSEGRDQLCAFLAEHRRRFSIAVIWTIFQYLIGDRRLPRVRFTHPDYEASVANGGWPDDCSTPVSCTTNRLRPFYAWPDRLAVLYANRYRSTFLVAYLLAAMAVGMALVPVLVPDQPPAVGNHSTPAAERGQRRHAADSDVIETAACSTLTIAMSRPAPPVVPGAALTDNDQPRTNTTATPPVIANPTAAPATDEAMPTGPGSTTPKAPPNPPAPTPPAAAPPVPTPAVSPPPPHAQPSVEPTPTKRPFSLNEWAAGLEVCTMLMIIGMIWLGSWQHWHRRWLDYRIVAELVRHLRLIVPLGGVRPLAPPTRTAVSGEPETTWMAWYARALERALGLPTTMADKRHLTACLNQLIGVLEEQLKYHRSNAERYLRLEHYLHRAGVSLLVATLAACVLHFLEVGVQAEILTFCCGFFPALGAALAGIVDQGEFPRIHRRSKAMTEQLGKLLGDAYRCQSRLRQDSESLTRQYSPEISRLASETARQLLKEVLDWRVMFLDRPLKTPS